MNITKTMHDAALHISTRQLQYQLSDVDAYDVDQVAQGFVGICDETAAERGVIVMRRAYKRMGKACPF